MTAQPRTIGPPTNAVIIAEARRILETSPVLVFVPGGQVVMALLAARLDRSDAEKEDALRSVAALRATVERMQSENHALRETVRGIEGELAQLAGAYAPEKG